MAGPHTVLAALHHNRREGTCVGRTVIRRAEHWPGSWETQVLVLHWVRLSVL